MRIGADPLGLCTRQLNAQQETSQTLGMFNDTGKQREILDTVFHINH